MAGTITLGGQTLASHDTASNTSSIVVDQLNTNGIEFNNSGLVLTKFETGTWSPTLQWLSSGFTGQADQYGTPVSNICTGSYTRIGNLVYITTPWIPEAQIPQDEICVMKYDGLPYAAAEYSQLHCGRARGSSMRYNTSIFTTNATPTYAYVNKGNYSISFLCEQIGTDGTGYLYIPTKTGSNLPAISGFYMTDED